MFHGSIPQDMRRILYEIVKDWDVSDIYVGCSGNFTVERVLAEIGLHAIHGNDVTLYSSIIGAYLSNQDFPIRLRDEYADAFGWLLPYLEDAASATATIMLSTTLLNGMSADGSLKENAYYDRLNPAFRTQWDAMHTKTRLKLESVPFMLASYHCGDVVPWTTALPADGGFISYPPFFSGDYENMFKKQDMLFEWDKPTYDEIGDGQVESFLESVTSRQYWAFGVNHRRPAYDDYLQGVTQTTNRGMPIYVYASNGSKRVVSPHQQLEPVYQARLTPGQAVGQVMTLAPLNNAQFQALRSQYMNIHIRPGQATLPVGVLVDGHLVGVFAFNPPSSYGDSATIYMLSDFAVSPTDYRRLSKLVLIAALSQEAKLLAERMINHRVRQVFTTAFSDNPVSMKYRGLFAVYNRTEKQPDPDKSLDHSQKKYQINYVSDAGQWTLAEGLALWQKKHSQTF